MPCFPIEIEKIYRILSSRWIIKGVHAKNFEVTLLFVNFFNAFYTISRGEMDQIQLECGLSKEIVTSIMMA